LVIQAFVTDLRKIIENNNDFKKEFELLHKYERDNHLLRLLNSAYMPNTKHLQIGSLIVNFKCRCFHIKKLVVKEVWYFLDTIK